MGKISEVTGVERFFGDDDIIVSKTDLKGHIKYCNDIFLSISGFSEKECLGQPHSMIRHPDMPRCVFALLWEKLQSGQEIFAYVMNRCKGGDHYWVNAHVTPSRSGAGEVVGYHSNRRVPDREVLETTVMPLYRDLLAVERSHENRKQGLAASQEKLAALLEDRGVPYDKFIATL